ncbi:MAG: phosphoribosylaminoimidazolesuccinocarboxamide synthase [Clostridiales bacterium]|nr:phosphoribosylaminoimidazolesuccinocarboxamide synthase [Clostridiales bacterium]
MDKKDMLYEGKAKRVYKTEDKDVFIVEYKDDATAFNGIKKGTITGKGIINNKMSALMFKMLEENGIPTHFVELINDRESLVKGVEILPLEVIVRNIAAGSFSKRYGVEEGILLPFPTVEFSYKNDDLGDPLINDSHALALGLATEEQIELIKTYALKINQLMQKYFLERNIKLIDFKLEFGLFKGEVILADEISPDTCRFWDKDTNEKLDKDRFRRDLGNVEDAYQEIMNRLNK